jgi:hypothetical protein
MHSLCLRMSAEWNVCETSEGGGNTELENGY